MNPKQLMKQVQQMQEQMQQQMAALRVEGSAGGGMVKATMNGSKELLAVAIDKEAVDPNDVEMLQDLVVAAVNEASRKVDEEMQSSLGAMTGGMKIPGTVLAMTRMTAPPLANLINELTKLPGIGGKSASRLAYHILKRPAAEAEALAAAILEVKQKIFRCSICNNMTDVEPCAICTDPRRDAVASSASSRRRSTSRRSSRRAISRASSTSSSARSRR